MNGLRETCPMQGMRKKRSRRIAGALLFGSLMISAAYAFSGFLHASDSLPHGAPPARVRSDYLLLFIKCILCMAVMWVPQAVARRWLPIPDRLYTTYYVFLYCAVFLGNVLDFYHVAPHWDILLHAFSGAMLCKLGFLLVGQLIGEEHAPVSANSLLVAVLAFCFALSVGALWEIYEFVVDRILDLNMQNTHAPDGTAYIGTAALLDTMGDLIADAIAAVLVAWAGYRAEKKKAPRRMQIVALTDAER